MKKTIYLFAFSIVQGILNQFHESSNILHKVNLYSFPFPKKILLNFLNVNNMFFDHNSYLVPKFAPPRFSICYSSGLSLV